MDMSCKVGGTLDRVALSQWRHFLLDTGRLCILNDYHGIPAIQTWHGPVIDKAPQSLSLSEYFETCMKDWSAHTPITKKECSRTSRRLANQRARFRLELGLAPK